MDIYFCTLQVFVITIIITIITIIIIIKYVTSHPCLALLFSAVISSNFKTEKQYFFL